MVFASSTEWRPSDFGAGARSDRETGPRLKSSVTFFSLKLKAHSVILFVNLF